MIRLILAVGLLATLMPAQAQPRPGAPPAELTPLERELAANSDVDSLRDMLGGYREKLDWQSEAAIWKRLTELRPHVGQIKVELAAAYAQQGLKSQAYTALLELQTQGYGMEIGDDARFKQVATTRAWEYIVDSLEKNLAPFGDGKVAYTLPKQDLLIESLTWDAANKRLLVGSIRDGAIFQVASDASLTPFIEANQKNGMWAVMDVVADAERNVLWVASTAVPHFKGYKPESDLGRAGIFKFDLKTGAFLKSYLSPTVVGSAFFMSTLALAPDGTVFAADGVNNAVYMVRDDQLKRLFHATTLSSIRGMAASGNGATLYFADAERGVFGYDLAAGKPFDVAVPKTLALAGIDGLAWWKDSLLAVQNGMQPARVMRLILAADGRSFLGAKPLTAGQPEFGQPTLATLAGDQLYFIANSQKGAYDRFGLPKRRESLEGTRIYAVAADFASDMGGSVPTGRPESEPVRSQEAPAAPANSPAKDSPPKKE